MLASLLKVLKPLVLWFDTSAVDHNKMTDKTVVDWFRVIPFIAVHAACLGVIWVGWSWSAIAVAASLYALRMFAITGFYHRYFSHRSFKTSRPAQFVFALLGASSAQRGPPTTGIIIVTPIQSMTCTRPGIMVSGGLTWGGSRRRATFLPTLKPCVT